MSYANYFLTYSPTELRHYLQRRIILYSCVKEIFPLWARQRFDTFHILLTIVEALWSQSAIQESKQVVVSRNESRAVRRVVKQFPVEKLHHCSSASNYHVCPNAHAHGRALHCVSIPLLWMTVRILALHSTLVTLLSSLVAWISTSALLFYLRKDMQWASWQGHNIRLNIFGMFSQRVFIHCSGCSLLAASKHKSHIWPAVSNTMWRGSSSSHMW